MIAFALISVATGFVVGVLSGLLGIGGGTILVSIFSLAYGMSALQSTATSLFTIIPTSISGVITHIRNHTCVVGVGLAAGFGGALMSPVGVWLASLSPEWLVMLAAALVIAYSAVTMFRKAFKLQRQQKIAPLPSDVSSFTLTPRIALVSALIGLGAGVLSGYVGVGGGFLMVPLFMSLLHLPMKMTSGSSLIAVMILAIPGTVMQAYLGNIDWLVGIAVAIGSIPGAFLGARLVKRVPELTLRFVFGGFLLVVAVLLAVDQFASL